MLNVLFLQPLRQKVVNQIAIKIIRTFFATVSRLSSDFATQIVAPDCTVHVTEVFTSASIHVIRNVLHMSKW